MSRTTENILLFLVGLSLAVIVAVGTFTRYVKPALLPWLVAAAILVMALAAAAMVRDLAHRKRHGYHPGDHGHGAAHAHSSGIIWLLVLPVAVLVIVPAPALGVSDASSSTPAPAKPWRHEFAPLPPGRTVDVTLTEVLTRSINDTAGTLNGRLINVVGFTITNGARTDLGRFYIICCAADARLHRLHLTGPTATLAAAQPDNTWLSVEGYVAPGSASVPDLIVSAVTPVLAPKDPYEYPS